ncbi:Ig-like domain-containing protein [Microbacteriaceae bacterium VKM Ac-2854]|nr:Ig-like domain-containing protein [Microbacteriaceae bacterium VKM Ac-2854]
MTSPSRPRRSVPRLFAILGAAVLALTSVLFVAAPAQATHYRADQLTWHLDSGTTVEFHINASFRASYFGVTGAGETFGAGTLDLGDGSFESPTFTSSSYDAANDVVTGEAHVTHTYPGTGPYSVIFSDCCRLSGPAHINNPDADISVVTTVDLSKATASPESAISPIVDCPKNATCSFVVPVVRGTAGSSVSYRFATAAESGITNQPGAPYAPNNASIDPSSGAYTWNTTGATLSTEDATGGSTFYSTQVIIEESVGGSIVSSVAVDFFIRLGTGTTNQAPVFQAPTPADGTTLTVELGDPATFSVSAVDADAADTVTPALVSTPTGATFTVTPGNPGTGTFSWTPTALGSTILVLTAQDQLGLQAVQRSVIADVVPAGTGPTPPVATDDAYAVTGTSLTVAAPGVLANDTTATGTLTAAVATAPTHGTVVLAADGSFVYTPTAGYTGTDTFTYIASNGSASSAAATVTLTVTAPSTPTPTPTPTPTATATVVPTAPTSTPLPPKKHLASTGVTDVAPLAFGSAAALLAGFGLLSVVAIRRRRNASGH